MARPSARPLKHRDRARLDQIEMNVEAMREHQAAPCLRLWLRCRDRFALQLVRQAASPHRPFGGISNVFTQAQRLPLLGRGGIFAERDAHLLTPESGDSGMGMAWLP